MKGIHQPKFHSVAHYINCLRQVSLHYQCTFSSSESTEEHPKLSLYEHISDDLLQDTSSSISYYVDCLNSVEKMYADTALEESVSVSIISSFYNVPKDYFIETNRSIKNQTFQNYEWIIANDCSTDDDAIALFQSLPKLNPKIKTIQRDQNGGLAAGRNTAIQAAKGKYLFFMDTDDLLDPTMIEKCVLFLETHPDFSFVNTYSLGFQAQEYWWDKGFNTPSEFINENLVTGRLLYRRRDFEEVGGFDESLRFYEDWERWLKAIAHGQKGWTIPEYLDCYRRTTSGLLATSRNKVEEEQRITALIKSRYQNFFKTQSIPDIHPERPMFDVTALEHNITIKNPVNVNNPGRRILCWFPHLEVGGADKFNLDLLIGLKQRGYDITILTTVPAQHRWFPDFYQVTPDIFHLPNLANYGHWMSIARYLIRSRHIDICFISNAYYAYYLLPLLRDEFPNVAFVDYTHTEDPGWRQGGYPRISCQFSNFLDQHIVTSKNLASQFIKRNPKTAAKLKICYINVDEQKWQHSPEQRLEYRLKMNIAEESVVILFPARMTGQKRPVFFVEIIKALVDKGLPITALMMGGGNLSDSINEQISTYGLESIIHRLEFVTPDDMLGYYSAADIVLLPSAYEGISLVLYEAMAMSLPVVASDVGGQRELVTPDTGFLLPLGDANEEECGQYVNVLQSLVKDSQTRHQISKAARKRIESSFCLKQMVDQIDFLFKEALEHRQQTQAEAVPKAMAEEIMLWVQEFLALDKSWHDFQHLAQEYEKLQDWAKTLEKERDLYKTQRDSWQQVARQNQIKLNQYRTSP